jgi:hypothetical protein
MVGFKMNLFHTNTIISLKDKINTSLNPFVIKITNNCDFAFLEEDVKIPSPVDDYYYKCNDLSINLQIKLKWALYGYFFLKSLSEQIITINDSDFGESINTKLKLLKNDHILYLDDYILSDVDYFLKILNLQHSTVFYDENAIIRFKLKLNFQEFI